MHGYTDTGMDRYMVAEVDGTVSLALPCYSFLTFAPKMYILASNPLHTVARGSFQLTI